MKLADLVREVPGAELHGDAELEIGKVAHDSRRCDEASLFVAIQGLAADGNDFVEAAVKKGATAVVSEESPRAGVPWIRVRDAREALALLSAAVLAHPGRELDLVGVTGTNGKTTTAFMIDSAVREAGETSGLVGTVDYRIGDRVAEAVRTTPESSDLQLLLRQMVDAGCRRAVLEVSSHALALKRAHGLAFRVAVFTNLSRDHLDFHEDMDAYFAAKRILFDSLLREDGHAVVNVDDDRGVELARSLTRPVLTCSLSPGADFTAEDVHLSLEGTRFRAKTPAGDLEAHTPLLGRFSVRNALCAFAAGHALGLPPDAVQRGLASLKGVSGRMERVDAGQDFTVLVDYAHTDDALKNLLETVRELDPRRVITVFGCGGDRDRSKRPLMGAVAARLSDVVILTSDNPRSEPPEAILEEVRRGIPADRVEETELIIGRREAIARALEMGREGVVVVIAGKGHETRQVLRDRTVPFDDRQVVRDILANPAGAGGEEVTAVALATTLTLAEVLAGTGGTLATADRERSLGGVSIDSRTIQAGELFVAIEGPRFDGHDFVGDAARRGAGAAVVRRDAEVPETLPLVRVEDTTRALGDLARHWRRQASAPVVGLTGSVGKTTTKEMTSALLATRGPVLKTEGNLNNHWGLPLTLLGLREEHTAAVLELGMSAVGEIRRLSAIAEPDVAVITRVAPVHLEYFPSVEAIADAKAEILEGVRPGGAAVLNADDPRVARIGESWEGRVVWFGRDRRCDVSAERWRGTAFGMRFDLRVDGRRVDVALPLAGPHFVENFLAAAATAHVLGVSAETMAEAATGITAAPHRGEVRRLGEDVVLLDDSYNSSPEALEAAVVALTLAPGRRRVAVVGDMLELGATGPALHRESGRALAGRVDAVVGVGPLAREIVEGAREAGLDEAALASFDDAAAAAAAVDDLVHPGDAVLVKGSRGIRLETFVDALAHRFGGGEA